MDFKSLLILSIVSAPLLGSPVSAQTEATSKVQCKIEVATLSLPMAQFAPEPGLQKNSFFKSFLIVERRDMEYVAFEPAPAVLSALSREFKEKTRQVLQALNSVSVYVRPDLKNPLVAYRVRNGVNPNEKLQFVESDGTSEHMIPIVTAQGSTVQLPMKITCRQI